MIEQAASQLKENNLRSLADYTSEIGATIKNFSDRLQNRSVDELCNQHSRYGPAEPTAFILGSIVIGIGISPFFKASTDRRQDYEN